MVPIIFTFLDGNLNPDFGSNAEKNITFIEDCCDILSNIFKLDKSKIWEMYGLQKNNRHILSELQRNYEDVDVKKISEDYLNNLNNLKNKLKHNSIYPFLFSKVPGHAIAFYFDVKNKVIYL